LRNVTSPEETTVLRPPPVRRIREPSSSMPSTMRRPELAERTRPGAFLELLPGAEERGYHRGRLAVDVDRRAEGGLDRTGGRADLRREILGLAGEVEAQSEDQFADRVGVEARFGEHPRDLAAVGRLQVVGPLQAELEAEGAFDMRAEREAHPERERLEPLRRDERPEREGQVEVAGARAVPLAAEAAATRALRTGQHGERRFLAGGEATLGFRVRAVDLVEQFDFRGDLEPAQVRVEQRGVERVRDGFQLVAFAGRSLEREAVGPQAFEPAPDRDAGDAELFRETVAADRFAVGLEEGEEDAAVEGGHGVRPSRGRGRTKAPRG